MGVRWGGVPELYSQYKKNVFHGLIGMSFASYMGQVTIFSLESNFLIFNDKSISNLLLGKNNIEGVIIVSTRYMCLVVA